MKEVPEEERSQEKNGGTLSELDKRQREKKRRKLKATTCEKKVAAERDIKKKNKKRRNTRVSELISRLTEAMQGAAGASAAQWQRQPALRRGPSSTSSTGSEQAVRFLFCSHAPHVGGISRGPELLTIVFNDPSTGLC